MKTQVKNKLFYFLSIGLLSLTFIACEKEDKDPIIETKIVEKDVKSYKATINFIEKVNGDDVVYNTSNMPYQNKKGQDYNISKLRFLISNVTFHKNNGTSFTIKGYHLFDNTISESSTYEPSVKVPEGEYESVSFTFGFNEEDNQTGLYQDLNLANWGWPGMSGGHDHGHGDMGDLGGGYHFMQLEGQYDSSGVAKGFEVHMGKAKNENENPPLFENNHFIARLPSSAIKVDEDFSFTLVMNIDQWFENPYEWDFNIYNMSIMGSYDAQKKLNINGPTVFTFKRE